MGYIAIALEALATAQKLYEIGKDVAPIIGKIVNVLTKGEAVTQKELEDLQALSDKLSDEIQAPLKPEES